MKIALAGFLIFLGWWLVHLFIWKLRRPADQTRGLFILFLVFLLIFAAAEFCLPDRFVNVFQLNTFTEWFSTGLLFTALVLAYIVTYSAVEQKSPTLMLVQMAGQGGADGIRTDRLRQKFLEQRWIEGKLDSLARDGLVVVREDVFLLTKKGRLLADLFEGYRRLAGFDQKGE